MKSESHSYISSLPCFMNQDQADPMQVSYLWRSPTTLSLCSSIKGNTSPGRYYSWVPSQHYVNTDANELWPSDFWQATNSIPCVVRCLWLHTLGASLQTLPKLGFLLEAGMDLSHKGHSQDKPSVPALLSDHCTGLADRRLLNPRGHWQVTRFQKERKLHLGKPLLLVACCRQGWEEYR